MVGNLNIEMLLEFIAIRSIIIEYILYNILFIYNRYAPDGIMQISLGSN